MLIINLIFLISSLNAGCITQDGVAFRSAPSKNAPVTWQVRKYFPVKKLKEETEFWFHVRDFEGGRHWVPKMYYTEKYHCVVVKVGETRVKKEPKMKSLDKYKESALKYETFKFLAVKRGWIYVKDAYGDDGWLRYKDVWVD